LRAEYAVPTCPERRPNPPQARAVPRRLSRNLRWRILPGFVDSRIPSGVLGDRTAAGGCERCSGGRVLVEPRIRHGHTMGTPGCDPWGSVESAVRPKRCNHGRFAPGTSRQFPQDLASGAKGRRFESCRACSRMSPVSSGFPRIPLWPQVDQLAPHVHRASTSHGPTRPVEGLGNRHRRGRARRC
jgi:hypothetical protein